MNKQYRFSFIFGAIIILCGFLTSPVYAGLNAGLGDNVLNAIKNNPCGNFHYDSGGTHSVPVATCDGHKGIGASIQILLRGWDIEPEYPLVSVPFSVGIGIDPSSARVVLRPKSTITFANQIKFTGYRTLIYLVPVPVANDFNGEFSGFSSIQWYKYQLPIETSLVTNTKPYSATIIPGDFYPGGNDTIFLGMSGLVSSYHEVNPSIYKGEPAYRLGVTSVYNVQAKATWDYYQEWVVVNTIHKEVCRPGRNAKGLYDCVLNPGGHYLNGHTESVTVDVYGWSDSINGNKQGDPVNIAQVTTNLVRWPDGTIHDHVPILIYQSQPLLQKP